MNRTSRSTAAAVTIAVTVASLGVAAATQHAVAGGGERTATYRVVVTNLTNGQPLSGPVVATHRKKGLVFEVGAPASHGVVQIAENGNNEPLAKQLDHLRSVGQVADVVDYRRVAGSYPGPVPLSARSLPSSGTFPPTSQSFTITAPEGSRLSWVAMLVCTNDGFTGADSVKLPTAVGARTTANAVAYTTSTETDNQLFANIMQPCQGLSGRHPADGAPGQHVSTTSALPGPGTFPDPGTSAAAAQYPGTVEGGVVVPHPGIRAGVGDLGAAGNYDLFRWSASAPVASISITRTG